jgi:sugar phosphate isomerase/epimerase
LKYFLKNKILISTVSFKEKPLKKTFILFNKKNFLNIEYNLSDLMNNKISLSELKTVLKKNNISPKVISGGWCDFFYKNQEENIASISKQVFFSESLGCKNLRIFYGKQEKIQSNTFDIIVKNLKDLSSLYPKINFYLENERGLSSNPEFCFRVMKEVNKKNIRVNFDPINFESHGCNHFFAYKILKNYIKHVHLKGIDINKRLCAFGKGSVYLDNFLKKITQSSYNGYYTIEFEGNKNVFSELSFSKNELTNLFISL